MRSAHAWLAHARTVLHVVLWLVARAQLARACILNTRCWLLLACTWSTLLATWLLHACARLLLRLLLAIAQQLVTHSPLMVLLRWCHSPTMHLVLRPSEIYHSWCHSPTMHLVLQPSEIYHRAGSLLYHRVLATCIGTLRL